MSRPGRRLAEGREAEVFEWDAGTVVRLLRDPAGGARMERSVAAMTAVHGAGVLTPAVHDVVEVDGRPGIVMDRVDGLDLFAILDRQPWKLVGVARTLGTVHARLNETAAPESLVSLREHIRECIDRATALPRELADLAVGRLDELPDGDRICHGDFQPGNVLASSAGPVVIDWANATRGDPVADIARTRLMLRLAEVPPGTSSLIHRMDRVGRRVFSALYTRSYAAKHPVDRKEIDRWEVVRAADRMGEGIQGEYPALLRFLADALR